MGTSIVNCVSKMTHQVVYLLLPAHPALARPTKRSPEVFWANSATLQSKRLWIWDYTWDFKDTCLYLANITFALPILQIQSLSVPVVPNTCTFCAKCLEYNFTYNWMLGNTIAPNHPDRQLSPKSWDIQIFLSESYFCILRNVIYSDR